MSIFKHIQTQWSIYSVTYSSLLFLHYKQNKTQYKIISKDYYNYDIIFQKGREYNGLVT